MADRIGRQVGNYRLISLLGQGGFADVYLGEHIYLRSNAAIKLLNTQLSEQNKEHFLEEARLLVNLSHPRIVRVLDFGVEGGTPFLVMEYAPHGSLRQLHPAGIPLPLAVITNYTRQVAEALQYAHEQKLIHRDIKPENMLLGRHNEILLSDFGIAVLAQSSLTQSLKEVAGTATYMAPEQFQGKPRPASDQYALGIVIYQWLCGRLPFKGTFTEIASQHLFAPPAPLQGTTPDITPDIEQVVMTALAKDPKQRFASILAFANALEQASRPSQSPLFLSISHESPLIAAQIESASRVTETHGSPDKTSSTGSNTSPDQLVASPEMPLTKEAITLPPQDSRDDSPITPARPSESPHRISRRAALAGLAILGTVGAVGGGVTLLEYIHSRNSTHSIDNTTPTLASSSGAMFGFNLQHTHVNAGEHIISTANVSRLTQAWATPVEGIIGTSSPAVANGKVYVGSFDHHVYAFDVITGKIVWMTPTQDTIYSSPAVANGVVYIGSADAKVYALDASSGHVLWTYPTGGGVNSSPAVVDGVVYIGSFDHTMYALNASSGKLIWTVPVVGGIFDSPAVDNGIVYIGTQEHSTFYAINISTGKIMWQMSAGDYINSSPAIAGGLVYVGSKDGKLYAFDAFTGKKDWTAFNIPGAEIASSPTIANGVLYVGSWNHNFYALDAYSGTILWNTTTGDGIESSPVVVNGVVYVGSRDHKLYAFKLPAS